MFPKKTSFASGEISPGLYGRTDLNQYGLAAKRIENMYVETTGGLSNRPGTKFVGIAPIASGVDTDTTRLIPFQFSTEQGYILEFSEGLIRVIQDGEYVCTTGITPVEIATNYSASDLFDIGYAQSADVLFLTHPNYPPAKLSRLASDGTLWDLSDVDFVDGPWADRQVSDETIYLTPSATDGSITIESSEAFFESTMLNLPFRIGYEDTEDPTDINWGWGTITVITDSTHADMTVEDALGYELMFNGSFESGLNGWLDNSQGTFTSGDPNEATWDPVNESATIYYADSSDAYGMIAQEIDYFPPKVNMTLIVNADISATGRMRVQGGKAINGSEYFNHTFYPGDDDGNGNFEITFTTPKSGSDLYITIDNRYETAGETVEINSVSLNRSDLTTNQWRANAFKYNTVGGYPRHILFHQQRMILASSAYYPQTIWMSRSASFYDFSFTSPTQDDDAISLTLASRKIDSIKWIVATRDLLIGTSSAVWTLSPGSQSDTLSPTSLQAKIQSTGGCASLRPLVVENRVLYVERGNRSIKEVIYSFESDSFNGRDLTLLSKHFFEYRTIVSWDYAQLNDHLLYCVMSDGAMCVMTYLPGEDLFGWTLYKAAASAYYKDVCTLENEDEDGVYLVTYRSLYHYFLATTAYYHSVEKIQQRINIGRQALRLELADMDFIADEGYQVDQSDHEGAYEGNYNFLDSSVVYIGTSLDTMTNLWHLNNKIVTALCDGNVVTGTVTNGELALEHDASVIIVGLGFTSYIDTLDFDMTDNVGSVATKRKTISKLVVKVKDSRSLFAAKRIYYEFQNGWQSDPIYTWITNDGRLESELTGLIPDYLEFKIKSALIDSPFYPTKLRTGDIEITMQGGWDAVGGISIKNDQPLPLTILAIIPEITISDA